MASVSSSLTHTVPAKSHVFQISFHPDSAVKTFATCHVSSDVYVWRQDPNNGTIDVAHHWKHHEKSCRTGRFFPDGCHFLSGSADQTCKVVDSTAGTAIWASKPTVSSSDAINVVRPLNDRLFTSGDDAGRIKVWDIRQPGTKPCSAVHEYNEVVFALEYDETFHSDSLLATCGDCIIAYDLRKTGKLRLNAMSDPQEADLLCCSIIKAGSKVLCGTASNGAISIFSWGDFGDMNDRIMLHDVSVDHILTVDTPNHEHDVLVIGGGDGKIRLISAFPHRLLGHIGVHNEQEEPIEALALSPDGQLLVSGSHDGLLKLYAMPSEAQISAPASQNGRSSTTVKLNDPNAFFSDL